MLANNWDGLGGGDVVSRAPVWYIGTAVEIFLNDLLSPRKSIASAHDENYYGRSDERQNSREERRNQQDGTD
jgi:hypothetical protein